MTIDPWDTQSHIVVVGGGAAGLTAIEELRRRGFLGAITAVCAEETTPYDRPPLSKQILSGTWPEERVALRRPAEIANLQVDWRRGICARSLDSQAQQLMLSDGTCLEYDGLIIATGVVPRSLSAPPLLGVYELRTLDHALALRNALDDAESVAIVGGGFLGTEVAAVARQRGCRVALVDAAPAPLARQVGDEVAELCAELHHAHGVDLRCGTGVARLLDKGHRSVTGIELQDGTVLDADMVLVAIGSRPATDWLTGSGLRIADGVVCDQYCLAGDNIAAAGDVARWQHPRYGSIRVEHRMNATEQGMAAARALLGERQPFAPVPYVWSDQYDIKLQSYGLIGGDTGMKVVVGDRTTGKFAALYGKGGHVTGSLAWNMPRAIVKLRRFVAEGTPWALAMDHLASNDPA